jgi:polysaccharide export outer membrane protein
MSRRTFHWLAAPLLLGIAGCASLPGTGPSASSMAKSPDVDVVDITPDVATAARQVAVAQEKTALDRALLTLRAAPAGAVTQIAPGDVIDVSVWSFSPWPGTGNPLGTGGPGAIPLGAFTVGADGAVQLPYAGRIDLTGLTPDQAQAAISARYTALRILQRPTAAVKVMASPRNDVLVTGAIGQPRTIPWTPAGMTLAQAVTQSLGDGNGLLGQGELSKARSAVKVSVLRGGQPAVELPVVNALEEQIPLQAGDRIVVSKAPAVQVTVLGGGARRDAVIGFARQPVLAEALAEASGLDGNSANDHAVFVMRRQADKRPVLYNFAWNKPMGIVSAQQFPLEDGDLVYVADAPLVSAQKVIGLIFQATLPAQVLR